MKRTKSQPTTIGELISDMHAEQMKNEADRHIVQNIIKEAETSGTNNSLMVYTSSVNSTNIEDRTMSTEQQLQSVHVEINDLREALNNDVQKVDNVLLSAKMAGYVNCPQTAGAFLSEEWIKSNKRQEQFLRNVSDGNMPEGLSIRLTSLSFDKRITLTRTVRSEIEDFEDRIEDTYQMPMMMLQRKRAALDKMVEAERGLKRQEINGNACKDCDEACFFGF